MKDSNDKLTEKEEEAMFLLWEHGPCSVKDLINYYPEPKPHVNTVSTFVRTLEAKGYVGHEQGRYGSYNYFALKSKSEYRKNTFRKIVGRFFGNSFSMVSNLVENEELDEEQLRSLLEMVKRKKSQ